MSDEESISRREALKGGSAAAVAVGAGILQDQVIGVAKGQTNEPRIQLGPDYAIDDKSPGFVIEHQPSGATFQYDENQNRWVATDPVEVPSLIDGAGVSHSGELEDASHDHSGETINPNTVNTDELLTTPAGVRLQKSSAQSAADNTLVDPVTWETATEYNADAPAFGDTANNVITVPNDDYSLAKFTVSIEMSSEVEFDFLDLRKSGGAFPGQFRVADLADSTSLQATSSWIPVTSGQDFKVRLRQVSGGPVDIEATVSTWFSAVFF